MTYQNRKGWGGSSDLFWKLWSAAEGMLSEMGS